MLCGCVCGYGCVCVCVVRLVAEHEKDNPRVTRVCVCAGVRVCEIGGGHDRAMPSPGRGPRAQCVGVRGCGSDAFLTRGAGWTRERA